jgi:putative membrane-bound dehydrogenase-like protein
VQDFLGAPISTYTLKMNSKSLGLFLLLSIASAATAATPQVKDKRLQLTLFAEHPQIVTPTGLAVDRLGRVLVIENHTHFTPKNYKGPKTDRIAALEDTNGDGKADKITTFYNGFKDGMDLTTMADGTVYLATRRSILRLEDLDKDGKADKATTIVTLETKGNYPHNGLAGLAFDLNGTLHFGFGENLGHDYKLIGSDGTSIQGGAEGGSTYRCDAEGKDLIRISTGYWNPFGMSFDAWGNLFAVDNDPDSSPPCRLIHVIEGGDYGYQYRYGRSGISPLHAWNGQLPGTLPMVAGTGEAPCGMLCYQADGLPQKYRDKMLVASWGDHRIEAYELTPKGATFSAKMSVVVRGGHDFRPVDMATGPKGGIFICDWVDPSYKVHGKGRIWRLSALQPVQPKPRDPLRTKIARWRAGKTPYADADVKQLLMDPKLPLNARGALVRLLLKADDLLSTKQPAAIRLAAINEETDPNHLLKLLDDPDPFVRARASSHEATQLWLESHQSLKSGRQRIGALRSLGWHEGMDMLAGQIHEDQLNDPDPDVRLFSIRILAEADKKEYRPDLEKILADPKTTRPIALAALAALAHFDEKSVDGKRAYDLLKKMVKDAKRSAGTRAVALQLLPTEQLSIADYDALIQSGGALRASAVERLLAHRDPKRFALLERVTRNTKNSVALRADAISGLDPVQHVALLMEFATSEVSAISDEALRRLTAAALTDSQRKTLGNVKDRPMIQRLLGKSFAQHPEASNLAEWTKLTTEKGNANAGRRIFFGIGTCGVCHQHNGRGARIGPDLSRISHGRNASQLLEAILKPSANVAPQFQLWVIQTSEGKTITGFHASTRGAREVFVDISGKSTTVQTEAITSRTAVNGSIMPPGLLQRLTGQEVRDLIAFLSHP